MKSKNYRQLIIALAVYLGFVLSFLGANVLSYMSEGEGTLEMLAGILLGFVGFPIFCLGLPLWLARRWQLEFAFWPRRKNWLLGLGLIALYVVLTQQQSFAQLAAMNVAWPDFLIHFVSTTLFHISYYPLFAVLLLPVLRRNFGAAVGVVVTAVLFALYHLTGFYYFPAGLTFNLQVLLFASFLVNLLLYLWTENLIAVALAHTVGGSLGLVMNGTLFNQVDEMLIITAVIMTTLFAYMITYEIRHRQRPYRAGWWLQVKIDPDRAEAHVAPGTVTETT